MREQNKTKKIISCLVSSALILSITGAFAAYPEPAGNSTDGYVYHYTEGNGTWDENAGMNGCISKVQGVGSEGDFSNKWLNGQNYVKDYSNGAKRFTVGGKHFMLLDTDEEGNYFVIADDLYGQRPFTNITDRSTDDWKEMFYDGTWKYDPENRNSIAYWLNNGFLTEGNRGDKLPDSIISNLVEKEWGIEGGTKIEDTYFYTLFDDGQAKYTSVEPYVVTQKVSLPSAVEMATYWEDVSVLCYGLDPNTDRAYKVNAWWLRTVDNAGLSGGDLNERGFKAMYVNSGSGVRDGAYMYNNNGIRPCFWINKDFFATVKLDELDTEAANVVTEIKKAGVTTLLDLGYTAEELQTIGLSTDVSVSAKDVYIEGEAVAGNTITAHYTTAFGNKSVEWQCYDTESGEYKTVESNSDTLTLKNEYAGKMRLKVSADGNAPAYSPEFTVTKLDTFAGSSALAFDVNWTAKSEKDSFAVSGGTILTDWAILDKVYGEDGKAQLFLYTNGSGPITVPWFGEAGTNDNASQKYDVTASNSVAARLHYNNYGGGNSIYQTMWDYVKPHNWRTEAGHEAVVANDYFVNDIKAAALSVWEYKKYGAKIGLPVGVAAHLRTPAFGADNKGSALSIAGSGAPKIEGNASLQSWGISLRPALYLGIDYFKAGIIDTENTADDSIIYDLLKQYYKQGDLASNDAATDAKLSDADAIPSANNLTISGSLLVGETVTAEYKYSQAANGGAAESDTAYQWYAMGASGVYEPIEGATDKEFELTADVMGRKILVEVIPADANGAKGLAAVSYSNDIVKVGTPKAAEIIKIEVTEKSSTSVKAQATVTSEDIASCVAIIAIYDENNTMLACNTENIDVVNNSYSGEITLTTDKEGGKTCKAMIWSSMDKIQPLCEADEQSLASVEP